MTASRVRGFARLALVSGVVALVGAGLCACSTPTAQSTAASTMSSASATPSTTQAARSQSPATSETRHAGHSGSTRHTTKSRTTTAAPTSSTQQPTTTPPSATVVKTFSPFDATTGKPVIRITSTRTGYCWIGSIALAAPNAYRCMAHNLILDPCFAPTSHSAGYVICVDAPWQTGARLNLNRALPSSANTGAARSGWALQLANGKRCVAVTGTVRFVDNVPMNYACDTEGSGAGDLQHTGAHWTVEYMAAHATSLTQVDVSTVWK